MNELISSTCIQMWQVLNYGIQGLKSPDLLSPAQFLTLVRNLIDSMAMYYFKCGPLT